MRRKIFRDWNLTIDEADEVADDVLSFESRSLGRSVSIESTLRHQPDGIRCAAVAAGIKHEGVLDLTVIKLDEAGSAAGVFTKNMCPGAAVTYDRNALVDGRAQVLAVISKNANVFTPHGDEDTAAIAGWISEELAIPAQDALMSFTGVIGVALPMDKIRAAIAGISGKLRAGSLDDAARAILTTDRGPKVCSVRFGDVVVCGMAKGAGMLEPNMATMLVYFFTNADIDGAELKTILVDAVERTFNSLSVDSDTSTSDSVIVFSTRRARLDDAKRSDFIDAVRGMALKLARDVVAQAEGSTKLIECTVRLDTSAADARIMAKKVVNSPLVKTAVHGGDPNWGRIVMAIGKPDERLTIGCIAPQAVVISMMGQVMFSRAEPIHLDLAALSHSIRGSSRVSIDIRIGEGQHEATVWGCDLSPRYIEINAEYMT